MTESLDTEWQNVTRNVNAEEVFNTFRNVLLHVMEKMVGRKMVKVGEKEGNAWWIEEVKKVVKEKS